MDKVNTKHILIGAAVVVGLIAIYWVWKNRCQQTAPIAPKASGQRRNMVFYNFGSNRCPHSIQFTQKVLPELQKRYQKRSDVIFKTIDVDTQDQQEQNLIFYFQVDSTPTLVLAGSGFKKQFDDHIPRTPDNLTRFIEEASVQPPVSN